MNRAIPEDELRLFNLVSDMDDLSSSETGVAVSQSETPHTSSGSETRASHAPCDHLRYEALVRVRDAARVASAATNDLEEVIAEARLVGCSWRAIAELSGIPFQTLHRRARRAR
jgi:DNA-directed RNA polymerase specialized sigma24 family protein